MGLGKLVGASVKRVEDERFLRGRAQYTSDIAPPGTLHVAFVRSVHAHARLVRIDASEAVALPGVRRVVTGSELAGVLGTMGLPFREEVFPPSVFKQCKWPCLAQDKVRYDGEPLAVVIAESRYIAEDAAELVEVEYEALPPVLDPERALDADAPLVHEEFGDNVVMQLGGGSGDVEAAFERAAFVVSERFQTNRHSALPLEGRAVLGSWSPGDDITLWTSSQMPHLVRTRVAELMRHPESKLQVIAPDVGGGFGQKCHVFPEEVLIAHLARELRASVLWTEDRRESLLGSFHAKDDIVECGMAFSDDGTILGMRARVVGDLGAYSADPWPSPFEALQLAAALPGPYRIRDYAYEVQAVCTNKTTLTVYRGVGLTAAVMVQEQLLDQAARRLGMDPADIRRKNLIRPDEFPYTSATGLEYDTSSSTEALEKGLEMIRYGEFRDRQAEARNEGRYLGVGICTYIEMTTFGTRYWVPLGIQHSAYESATVQMDPSGCVTLSVGTFSHGQGHATTYAQMVADELGVEMEDVRLVQGDTRATPYGWGTWGSRSVVAGGGAVIGAARKVREKMLRVAAHLLETSSEDIELADGRLRVAGVPGRSLSVQEVARAAVFSAWKLPESEAPGLEATHYYDPPPVTFANATHIATVEVDIETGRVRILDYVVAEDCGTLINPMIVEGQVVGGVAQGVGTALYEHLRYDESGALLTTSLMDYLVPQATDVPACEVGHLETPTPLTELGVKGMGEGGAIGAPSALANAVADALAPFGAKVTDLPLTPERVWMLAHPEA